jgi:hypothetical protein
MKSTNKITKKTLIAEKINQYPDLAQVLTEDYVFIVWVFCLQHGVNWGWCQGPGMADDEIKVMLENLNELIEAEGK